MSESMGKWPKIIKDKAVDTVISKLLASMVPEFRAHGWKGVRENLVPRFLESTGVKPEFLQENDPGFAESRHRLNTEPGVIICNHPGTGEIPIILSALRREDLKIIVSDEQVYRHLPPDIAEKYFLSAKKDYKTMRAFLKGAEEHIRNGGIFLIFPKLSRSVHFEKGFRSLLQKLRPDDMIYCFNVNSSDAANFPKTLTDVGLSSELYLHPATSVNELRQPITMRTAEEYTKATDWQSAIADLPDSEEADIALTEKYEGMFASNK